MEQPTTTTLEDPVTESGDESLRDAIIAAIRTVYDPEIPVNIYELGLIYEININPGNEIDIKMTLTAPSCPEAGAIPGRVQDAVMTVPGIPDCKVEIVWEPQWHMGMMSEAAKLELNLM